ncbi:MAG: restriction endonuclease subunit S [Ignavibacteriae bacterium]|nr:restriction endonuclease subunit S [Ignavibacteriota bacterium]MCB9216243.1 restriction endonuclease subunit S [Ignavibacteria bacterium]
MIEILKPYSHMKDSGVEWLGQVPEHWEVRRGKYLFSSIDRRSATGEEELLTVSSKHGVVPRKSANVTMFAAESYVGHKLCWPGDLVINSLWAWAGGLGVSEHHGIVSTAYGVYRHNIEVSSRFVHELVRSVPFHWELRVRSKGVWTSRLQLTDESFLGAEFPIPTLPEQTAIVKYLNHVDRKVKRFIRAKRKLIALLEEQKQVIIHNAVTRGLDPNVPMKDSGVEWLGEVPEGWKVVTMGAAVRSIQTGPFGSQLHAADYITGGVPVINPSHLAGGQIVADPSVSVSSEKAAELTRHKLRVGDIVAARRGELGRCALVTDHEAGWLCGTGCLRIRPKSEMLEPSYLEILFGSQGIRDTLSLSSIGATMDNLNAGMVSRLRLPCPPVEDQRQILDMIRIWDKMVANASGTTHHEITLLNEYRTRLISDVVTGKLDVREAAAALPDEVEEEELEEIEVGEEGDLEEEEAELFEEDI